VKLAISVDVIALVLEFDRADGTTYAFSFFVLSLRGRPISLIYVYIFIHHEGRNIKTTQKGEEKL